jgi:HEAT repeat protein/DNA polymerase III delta prime subunit
MSADFQNYLQSVCDTYQHWWTLYTITDVEGSQTAQRRQMSSLFDFGLMVQTVPTQQERGETEEKTERLPVQEGILKYAAHHVLLVGKPGSGKSTALARLLLEEAQPTRQDAHKQQKIPVLVELRQYKTSVLDLIRQFLERHQLRPEETEIKDLLFHGQFLLLVDGVNELPNEDARRDLKTFRQNYPHTPMIFTTRDLSVGGDLGIEKKLEMQPLTEEQMQQFVCAYLPEQGEEMLRRLGGRLREFGQTPLLLFMLCKLFEQTGNVPPNLGLVFRCFAQSYDGKIKDDVPVSGESRRWWQELLQHLAFEMMQGETPTELRVTIDKREAEEIFEKFLQGKVDYPPSRAKEWLEDLLKHHLIQVVSNEKIEFRHQLLQEYYAAECLFQQLSNISNEKLKRDYLNYLKWTEPLALMLALVEKEAQAVRVVELALDVDLALGARLAGEVKREFQEKTVGLILELKVPELLKIEFLGITKSGYGVAFLSHRLLQHENSSVRRRATEALGKIKDTQAVQALIQALNHEDSSVRWSAAEALGEIRDTQAVQALIQALNDKNSSVRWRSADALGKIKDTQAVQALIQALNDEDSYMRRRATEALGKIKDTQAVQALIRALNDEDSYMRWSAAEALGEIKDTQAVPYLIHTLNDKDSSVRRRAAEALGEIKDTQAVPYLIHTLNDKDSSVRRRAVEALGEIKDTQAVPYLIHALNDKDSSVRWRAVEALGEIKDTQAVQALIQALNDEDSYMRWRAANALGEIKDIQAVQALIRALNDEDSNVRKNAAYVLGEIKDTQAVQALIRALNDEDSNVRISATDALGEIKDTQAVQALIQALNDENSDVRRRAAEALGEIGSSERLFYLSKLLLARVDYAENAILKIQERYKFYNHEIFHSPPVEEENQSDPLLDTLNKLNRTMSETPKYDFRGSNIGNFADTVQSGGRQQAVQHIYAPEQKQNLVEAAKEIQQLLNQLSQNQPITTEEQKKAVVNQAIARIKRDNPTTWQRLRSAGEAALIEALKEVLDNPFVNVTVAAIEGYRDAE